MNLSIKPISINEQKEHLALIHKNQKSEARRIDPQWRNNVTEMNYLDWIKGFTQQGSKGVYLDHNLIGEVIFYTKEDKTFFGMWIDCDLMGKGIGQRVLRQCDFPPNTYVEFLNSNERVNYLLLKNQLTAQAQNEIMSYCKIS